MTDTVLELIGMGIAPYSTRGAVQSLEPIGSATAGIYRDVNGVLRNVGGTSFQKYKSTINCQDQAPAALDGIWPGKLLTVTCIQELCYPDVTGAGPQRDLVTGSERTVDGFIFYRPILSMMVTGFSLETDEWRGDVSWRMDLEEV